MVQVYLRLILPLNFQGGAILQMDNGEEIEKILESWGINLMNLYKIKLSWSDFFILTTPPSFMYCTWYIHLIVSIHLRHISEIMVKIWSTSIRSRKTVTTGLIFVVLNILNLDTCVLLVLPDVTNPRFLITSLTAWFKIPCLTGDRGGVDGVGYILLNK